MISHPQLIIFLLLNFCIFCQALAHNVLKPNISTNTCESSLLPPAINNNELDQGFSEKIPKHRVFRVFYFKGEWYTKYVNYSVINDRKIIIETLHFEVHKGLPKNWKLKYIKELTDNPEDVYLFTKKHPHLFYSIERFNNIYLPLIGMANEQFEKRRGWGRKFSLKNITVALENLENSIYVVVKNQVGQVLGGIRNIAFSEFKEKLPMEIYLDVELPKLGLITDLNYRKYWKNEIGAYVIDRKLPKEMRTTVILALWTQLLEELMHKQNFVKNMHKQAFFTYADKPFLYTSLGFKRLRVYKYKGKWVDYSHLEEKDIPGIIVDDGESKTEWWPLVFLPSWISGLKKRFKEEDLSGTRLQKILNIHHLLSDEHIGNYQFDALFSYLIQDLLSPNKDEVINASKTIQELIMPYIEYQINLFENSNYTERMDINELDWLKRNSDNILNLLIVIINQQVYKLKGTELAYLAELIGKITTLPMSHLRVLNIDQLLNSCFWPILNFRDIKATTYLLRAINQNNDKSPDEWLKMISFPLNAETTKVLAKSLIKDRDQLKVLIESLRTVIFEKVELKQEKMYLNSDNESLPWVNTINKLEELNIESPLIFKYIFMLAVGKQKLLEQRTAQ
ncbi:MAG: hypothetical protein KDD58_07035 [Bdellovibrionales bacterium]|nr:hypothetical protein [Bdellovibrionales bacterium]